MSTVTTGPFNLQVGQSLVFQPSVWPSPDSAGSVVVFNYTAYIVIVNTSNGPISLGPLTADTINTNGQTFSIIPPPPNTSISLPMGTYLGIVSLIYFSVDDAPSDSYPQTLVPSAGVGPPVYIGSINAPISSMNVAIPVGCTLIQIANLTSAPLTFTLTAEPSGITYLSADSIAANSTLSTSIRPGDSYLTISFTGASAVSVYASPLPLANSSNILFYAQGATIGNGNQILPAPPVGLAYYVTDFEAMCPSVDTILLESAPVTNINYVSCYCPVATQWATATINNPVRIATGISVVHQNVNENSGVIIRGYLGP
jgi:hypothetical protein